MASLQLLKHTLLTCLWQVPNRTHDIHTGTLHVLLKALSVYALQNVPSEQRGSWWLSTGHVGQVRQIVFVLSDS
jgi:hypothetical protein